MVIGPNSLVRIEAGATFTAPTNSPGWFVSDTAWPLLLDIQPPTDSPTK